MELIFALNQIVPMLQSVNLVVNAVMGTTETLSMVSHNQWLIGHGNNWLFIGLCEPMGSICDHLGDECWDNYEFIDCNVQDWIGTVNKNIRTQSLFYERQLKRVVNSNLWTRKICHRAKPLLIIAAQDGKMNGHSLMSLVYATVMKV